MEQMKHSLFHLHIGKHFFFFYCKDGLALEQISHRGCEVSFLGALQKPSVYGSEQAALGVPAWERILG